MLVELKLEGFDVDLSNGDITSWARQGVFLLNSALTVVRGRAASHQGLWRDFTTLVIRYINAAAAPSAWLLWGREAVTLAADHIDRNTHYIKAGGHPSPMSSMYFFGRNYFHCANKFLRAKRRPMVNWQLPTNSRSRATRHMRCDFSGLDEP